jgi:Domain of unknown function (DUF3291)
MKYNLAQINISKSKGLPDSPVMASFMEKIDEVNAIAESSPGFLWRLKSDDGNATSIKVFDDEMIIVNMSVWESFDAFKGFVFNGLHAAMMRRRNEWFEKSDFSNLAMWWIPEGHTPTTDEAKGKLEKIATEGDTQEAFRFKNLFSAPE